MIELPNLLDSLPQSPPLGCNSPFVFSFKARQESLAVLNVPERFVPHILKRELQASFSRRLSGG
jgi:hypothetical protein